MNALISTPLELPSPTRARLVADIGGTHARFGLVAEAGGPVIAIERLRTDRHQHLEDAVRAYLACLPPTIIRPTQACFAVAVPLVGDAVAFTNNPWRLSRRALQRELGLDALHWINDFEALALALPGLEGNRLRAHGASPAKHGTLAVVGPGTGLGVAGLTEGAAGWQAIPGEGGHATLAPLDDFEAAVLAAARREVEHVSAERLLSGLGLPLLHRAVALASGRSVDGGHISTEGIVRSGVDGSDPGCTQTLSVFCAMLGTFAGNVALTFGAQGGLYIGGGIVPRMADVFFASAFRDRFEAKGRYRAYMQAIPTALILDPHAALSGASLALAQKLGDRF